EQLTASRLSLERTASGRDYSNTPEFRRPTVGQAYIGPVRFRSNSEPFLTVAVSEAGRQGGVTVAEVNLKFMREVVSGAAIGPGGTAYVVDGDGRLIAHPDMSLVLRQSDFARLSQVRRAVGSDGN